MQTKTRQDSDDTYRPVQTLRAMTHGRRIESRIYLDHLTAVILARLVRESTEPILSGVLTAR